MLQSGPSEEDSCRAHASHALFSALDRACTPSMEPNSCAGGCRRTRGACVLLLLLLHLISVHGGVMATNSTQLDAAANRTAPLSEQEGLADVVTVATRPSGSVRPNVVNTVTPRAGRVPRAGGEEEGGSGLFGEPVVPGVEEVAVASPSQISPDSAETELLLPSNPGKHDVREEEGLVAHNDPPWIHDKDIAVFDLDPSFTSTHAAPPPPSTHPANLDVLHVDFFDPSSRGRKLDLAPPSTTSPAHELQGGDPTSWAMPDNYDYLTPYEDGVSPTADEYADTTTDAYESDGSPARSRPRGPGVLMPNFPAGVPPASSPVDGSDGMGGCRVGYQMVNASCRSPCDFVPNYCYNGGQCYMLEGAGTFCRCNVQDYIWHKGARCEAVVTEFQVMCLAVGASAVVVLLLFMMVVCFAKKLHVLKTENKKLRRRSKYRPTSEQHNDNFSLSTIAEGSHPNVRKLCDTPPNAPHARALAYYDNIICQDDPTSQNKLEDAVKAPPQEDESLNIHNALTPKHDNHKLLGEDNSSEVNSLQNNMM
ncbi:chondroitin sulfate proteoglycan 5-like isoform X1 [Dunckerocampus dactyliophorus]|uniref:chondroitin sulfate proteoglycan 5-like isoform X1 n=1 Tax=Dunckerocampus dactyliophorus TaxID=161453 RepID=UPI0024065D8D|nr:chondroitin sulfate proteoglycan 5-like isoform X1 [Dunckerocampus dactyliophorus]